jgi:ribonuclease HI
VGDLLIDKFNDWGSYDGASQDLVGFSSASGLVFISDSHCLKFKEKLGPSSNNHAKLLALRFLLNIVINKGVQQLQVFEVSSFVINLMKGELHIQNVSLKPSRQVGGSISSFCSCFILMYFES